MKKLLSVAFAIVLTGLVLAGCEREPVNPVDPNQGKEQGGDTVQGLKENAVYDQFKLIQGMLGIAKTEADRQIMNTKWKAVDGMADTYLLTLDNCSGELHVYATADGTVCKATCSMIPYKTGSTYKSELTRELVLDLVKKISLTVTLGESTECRFYAFYDQVGAILAKNFDEMDKYVDESKLSGGKCIWLENTIARYDLENDSRFIGARISTTSNTTVDERTATEYTISMEVINNVLANGK